MHKLKTLWTCFSMSAIYFLIGGIMTIEELIRLGPEKALTYVVAVIGVILMLIGLCGILFFGAWHRSVWHSIKKQRINLIKPENILKAE